MDRDEGGASDDEGLVGGPVVEGDADGGNKRALARLKNLPQLPDDGNMKALL